MDPAPFRPKETALFPPVGGNACIVPVWGNKADLSIIYGLNRTA
jgi:hypothetical protein